MITASAVSKTACSWDDINGLMPPTPCQRPAICTVTEACEHEHVSSARACFVHAGNVLVEENWVCHQCTTGPQPHDCPVTNVFTWDG